MDFDQFNGSQPPPPLKKSSQNQGRLTGVQTPLPKFGGGVATPTQPPPPVWRPWQHLLFTGL